MANSTTSGAAFHSACGGLRRPGVRRRTARRGRCLTQPTLRPATITGIAAAWRNHQQTGIVRNPGLSIPGTCAQRAPARVAAPGRPA